MRLEQAQGIEGPVIKGFSGGGFRIDDNVYAALLITPARADGWTPPPVAALTVDLLAAILGIDPAPEFLLLGTGPTRIHPPIALIRDCEARAIGVETMDSRAAARAWGVLRAEGRWIVGALYAL